MKKREKAPLANSPAQRRSRLAKAGRGAGPGPAGRKPAGSGRSPADEVRHGRHKGRGITYELRRVLCGKAGCARLHGPYWYAYWKQDGRTRTAYIGREFRRLGEPKPKPEESEET